MKKNKTITNNFKKITLAVSLSLFATNSFAAIYYGKVSTGENNGSIIVNQIYNPANHEGLYQSSANANITRTTNIEGERLNNAQNNVVDLKMDPSFGNNAIPNYQGSPIHPVKKCFQPSYFWWYSSYNQIPCDQMVTNTSYNSYSSNSWRNSYNSDRLAEYSEYSTPTSHTIAITNNGLLGFDSLLNAENTLGAFVQSHISSIISQSLTLLGSTKNATSNINNGSNNLYYNITFPVNIGTYTPGQKGSLSLNREGGGYRNGSNSICVSDGICFPDSSSKIISNPATQGTFTPGQEEYIQDTITIWPNGSYQQTGFNRIYVVPNAPVTRNVIIFNYNQGEMQYQLPEFLLKDYDPSAGTLSYQVYQFNLPNKQVPIPEPQLVNGNYTYTSSSSAKLLSSGSVNLMSGGSNALGEPYGSYDNYQEFLSPNGIGILNCGSVGIYNGAYRCISYAAGSVQYVPNAPSTSISTSVDAIPGNGQSQSSSPVYDLYSSVLKGIFSRYNASTGYLNYQSFIGDQDTNNPETSLGTVYDQWPMGISLQISNLSYAHQCGQANANFSMNTQTEYQIDQSIMNFYLTDSSTSQIIQLVNTNPQQPFINQTFNADVGESIPEDDSMPTGYISKQLVSHNFYLENSAGEVYNPQANLTGVYIAAADNGFYGSDQQLNNSIYPLAVIANVFGSSVTGYNNHWYYYQVPYQAYDSKTNSYVTKYKTERTCKAYAIPIASASTQGIPQ